MNKQLLNDLEEIVNRGIADSYFPVVTKNSIRIKHMVVRKSKKGYLVIDSKEGQQIAFTEFKVNRLHCEVLDSNKNVVQLSKKFGFVQEGVLRDYIQKNNQFHNVVILSLLKKDWELVSFRFDKYILN